MVGECEQGLLARLRKAQKDDIDLKKIFDAVERGEPNSCLVRGGVLYRDVDGDVRVVVPKSMRRQMIRKAGTFWSRQDRSTVEEGLLDPWLAC